ncbi:MAG: glycosyltransferase family 4 protein [Lutibacter sp.]
MKKILYIGNNLTNINPTPLLQLTKLFKDFGFEVFVYSNKKNRFLRLLEMCFGIFKHRNANYIIIDTYSTTNFYFAFVTSQLARLYSIKYIPVLHGGNLPKRIHKNPWLSKLIFKNAEINVSPSLYLQKEFEDKQFKTIFIPNAIDSKNYTFKKRNVFEPNLLWVRAFDKIYNPLMAVEVLFLLKKKYPSAGLCMIGADKDGSLQEVKKLAKQRGVFDSVEFTGLLSKLEWIRKSEAYDILINTTTIDNMPVSVIEAMALGLPVVSTNVGGLPYLINDKKDGFLTEENNATKMAEVIIGLIENPEETTQITLNARAKVMNFELELVKMKWIKILN